MTITSAGFEDILTDGYAQLDYLAVGTGTPSGSGLGNEVDRVAIATKNVSGGQLTLVAFFTDTEAVGVLTEVALYDAAAAGTLQAYTTFGSSIDRASPTGGLKVTATVTLTNA